MNEEINLILDFLERNIVLLIIFVFKIGKIYVGFLIYIIVKWYIGIVWFSYLLW